MAKTSTNGRMVGGKDGTSRHARQTEEFAGAISMAQHTRRSNSGSFIRSQSMGDLEHIKMTRNCNKTKFIDQTLMVFYIPGCTMVFNNCLMRKIQERKPEFDLITMHDCWLYYICLGIGGKIISDKNAYIQYRQHGNNVIGAKRISIRKKIQMICQQNGSPRAKMIDEIIRLYGQDMKKEMLSKYKTFASYPKSIKAKNYFFKQSTENVFSTRELQKAKLRILFGSL